MKFVHLADLHIGKRVNNFSMIEDQKYILLKILDIIDEKRAEAVLISGDVYDKTVPSDEATAVFDEFITQLAKRNIYTFIISGNHDSAEKISYGARIFSHSGLYISQTYTKAVTPIVLNDEYGEINVYMLPFIKPSQVRYAHSDYSGADYNDAVKFAVDKMNIDTAKRNIILSHQFVTGSQTCESEELSVGGIDNVDCSVYSIFDYAALGHIHGAQCIKSDTVRYAGTPLKYSFSEVNHNKSVTVAELLQKGSVKTEQIPLVPKHNMRVKTGMLDDIVKMLYSEDYVKVVLNDEQIPVYAMQKLRCVFANIMLVAYDNKRTSSVGILENDVEPQENLSELEYFEKFYEQRNGMKMTDMQREYMLALIDCVKEENI